MIHIDDIFYVTIFNGKKCTRKTFKASFPLWSLKKNQNEIFNMSEMLKQKLILNAVKT